MTASTTVVSLDTKRRARKLSGAGITTMTYDVSMVSTEYDEEDDAVECGYVPGGVTVLGFQVTVSDLDTDNSPAMTFSIVLGSTELIVDSTLAQAGGSDFIPCVPTTTTAATAVSFLTTTAPTAAAETGTVQVIPWYISA